MNEESKSALPSKMTKDDLNARVRHFMECAARSSESMHSGSFDVTSYSDFRRLTIDNLTSALNDATNAISSRFDEIGIERFEEIVGCLCPDHVIGTVWRGHLADAQTAGKRWSEAIAATAALYADESDY